MQVRLGLSLILSLAVAIVASTTAQADSANVTVLGVRSLDAEDQLERRVSQAVHAAAGEIDDYNVSDREVSLAQMSLAHGCEEVDPPCLKAIAQTLSADRLIYGNLAHSGDKVRITLLNFDARQGRIDGSAERTVLTSQLSGPTLMPIVTELVARIAGKPRNPVGSLHVTGSRPGALVRVDGKPAGQVDANGELAIADVPQGRHNVEVYSADGVDRRELSVGVRAQTTTTVRAPLPQAAPNVQAGPVAEPATEPATRDTGRVRRALGYTFVGVAAGFAAATIYSWVRIGSVKHDLQPYADEFPASGPGSTNDVCAEAPSRPLAQRYPGDLQKAALESDAIHLCDQGHRLEKLQWVFVGGTAAFAGLGTWLLWSGYHQRERSLSVNPGFGFRRASLEATLRF